MKTTIGSLKSTNNGVQAISLAALLCHLDHTRILISGAGFNIPALADIERGDAPQEEYDRLRALGVWLSRCGQLLASVSPAPPVNPGDLESALWETREVLKPDVSRETWSADPDTETEKLGAETPILEETEIAAAQKEARREETPLQHTIRWMAPLLETMTGEFQTKDIHAIKGNPVPCPDGEACKGQRKNCLVKAAMTEIAKLEDSPLVVAKPRRSPWGPIWRFEAERKGA